MAYFSKTRILGIAMVVENPDGSRTLYGLEKIRSAELEFNQEYSGVESWDRSFFRVPSQPTIRLEAEASAGFIRHASAGFQAPPQLPKGIYLPNMQFHALPAPEDE